MIELFEKTPYLKTVFEKTAYKDTKSLLFLHHIVKNINPEFVLELGIGYGCSTIFMALGLEGGSKIISIDNYKTRDKKEVTESIDKCEVTNKVIQIEGDTLDCGNLVKSSPEIVFMDASHINKNLQSEYASLETILPDNHLLIIDDAFFNDIYEFVYSLISSRKYKFCILLDLHDGLAILGTCNKYLVAINSSVREGDGGG